MMPTLAKALLRDRRGAAATELALTLPVLLLILFGIIEFGRLLHDYQIVDKGVRDAGRYLSRMDLICPGAALAAADLDTARRLALTGQPDGDQALLYYWTDPTSVAVAVSCAAIGGYSGAYSGAAGIPQVTVTATVPFTFAFLAPFLDNPNLTIRARHNEVVIGD